MTDSDIHREPEDSRRMMLNSNIFALLLPRVGDGEWLVHRSAIDAITEFAKHGMFAD